MYVGFIINGSHPLLKTINVSSKEEIQLYSKDYKVLVFGFEFAVTLYPEIDLNTKKLDENVYYCFTEEEAKDKSFEQLNNFVQNCLDSIVSKYKVDIITKEYPEIDLNSKTFIFESLNTITITQNNTVYYINKQVFSFFNNTTFDKNYYSFKQGFSWDEEVYFPAILKALNQYKDESSLLLLLEEYIDTNKYFGALCLLWLNQLPSFTLTQSNIKTWERAYKVENYLSNILVKVNTSKVRDYASDEDNITFQNIYKNIREGYITQKYRGSDKVTGRIYGVNNGYSLQTLPKNKRDVVIAEKDCLICEFDYDYFEYSLLSQLVNLPMVGDPHIAISKLIFGEEKRDIGKKINYRLLYGQSIDKIINDLKSYPEITTPKDKLKEILIDKIKPITKLSLRLQKELKSKGFIENYFDRNITPEKEYACLNNYIQSTAADFVIIKIEKAIELLSNYNPINKIILQNHDSIVFNLAIEDINNGLALEIKNLLEKEENNLTNTITFEYGNNWNF